MLFYSTDMYLQGIIMYHLVLKKVQAFLLSGTPQGTVLYSECTLQIPFHLPVR